MIYQSQHTKYTKERIHIENFKKTKCNSQKTNKQTKTNIRISCCFCTAIETRRQKLVPGMWYCCGRPDYALAWRNVNLGLEKQIKALGRGLMVHTSRSIKDSGGEGYMNCGVQP